MQFYEKLVFIMNLTQTSNRKLAQALRVDPSIISRLRTGKRGIPRNSELLRSMALFFSERCNTDYQRRALSEMVGVKRIITARRDYLSEFLFQWLCGNADGVERFMRTFESLKIGAAASKADLDPKTFSSKGNFVYYGNEGKRAAVRAAYQHMLSRREPCTICILADETDDWLMEDYDFTASMQAGLLSCLERGFQIYHIIPSIYSGDQILESLSRWIPLYITGKVSAYFYPHIRDRLHRHTIILMPGQIALASHSMSGQSASYASMLTTDPRLLQAIEAEFQDCLSLCRPMLNTYFKPQKLLQCYMNFLSSHGFCIQKIHGLSSVTAPLELTTESIEHREEDELKRLGEVFYQEQKKQEQEQEQYNMIDIGILDSADRIRAGAIPIQSSYGAGKILYYTPKTYVLHLKKILQVMETHENYHFVPLEEPVQYESAILVKENHRALLVHASKPFTIFEISQPEIVALYREYLLRLAEKQGYTGIHRKRIKSKIRELIRELSDD